MARYFLAPKSEIVTWLQANAAAATAEMDNLKASQQAVEQDLKEAEANMAELLQQYPSLAGKRKVTTRKTPSQ